MLVTNSSKVKFIFIFQVGLFLAQLQMFCGNSWENGMSLDSTLILMVYELDFLRLMIAQWQSLCCKCFIDQSGRMLYTFCNGSTSDKLANNFQTLTQLCCANWDEDHDYVWLL